MDGAEGHGRGSRPEPLPPVTTRPARSTTAPVPGKQRVRPSGPPESEVEERIGTAPGALRVQQSELPSLLAVRELRTVRWGDGLGLAGDRPVLPQGGQVRLPRWPRRRGAPRPLVQSPPRALCAHRGPQPRVRPEQGASIGPIAPGRGPCRETDHPCPESVRETGTGPRPVPGPSEVARPCAWPDTGEPARPRSVAPTDSS